MVIDVNKRINNYLESIQRGVEIKDNTIIGNDNISEYLKSRGMDIKNFMYTAQASNCILNIRTCEDYEILKLMSPDSEVLMLLIDKEEKLKMITVMGIPRYTKTCEDIVLEEKKKNIFKDTDIYFNGNYIMKNKIISNEKGKVIAETYSGNSIFGGNTDINKILNSFDFSLDVIYTDKSKIKNIDVKYKNGLLSKEVLKEINIDIITEQGKKDVWCEMADQANFLTTSLNQIIMNNSPKTK